MPTEFPRASDSGKPTRGRARRVAKWAGLGMCLAVLAVGVWSVIQPVLAIHVSDGGNEGVASMVLAEDGSVTLFTYNVRSGSEWMMVEGEAVGFGWQGVKWLPEWQDMNGDPCVVLPLWMIFFPLALVTGVLWNRDALSIRRRLAGQCLTCGYDRAGLDATARCPECGAAGTVGKV